MWIIDSIKIMSILNSFYIDSAKKISDIVLPFSDKTRKTLLILTLKLDSGSKNKRFYFVRKNIAESDVDYEVLVSISNPDKYILISSLPKFIRSHLNKY